MQTKIATRTRRALGLAGVMFAVLASAGCGQHASPSDPAEGHKLLLAALEAWKGGDRPEALARRTPPIHVSDGEWMSGFKLVDFKADADGRLVGSDVNYSVILDLKTPRGQHIKREAVYAVSTRSQHLVLRQDTL